jgi:hypothetical protein
MNVICLDNAVWSFDGVHDHTDEVDALELSYASRAWKMLPMRTSSA